MPSTKVRFAPLVLGLVSLASDGAAAERCPGGDSVTCGYVHHGFVDPGRNTHPNVPVRVFVASGAHCERPPPDPGECARWIGTTDANGWFQTGNLRHCVDTYGCAYTIEVGGHLHDGVYYPRRHTGPGSLTWRDQRLADDEPDFGLLERNPRVECGNFSGPDADGDLLPDATESCLVEKSNPSLRFDPGEDCPAHSGVLARASLNQRWASVTVRGVFTFRRDCGDFLGIGAHDGDSESFRFAWFYAGGGWWIANSLWLSAHQGATGDSSTTSSFNPEAPGHIDYPPVVYTAENKHALYPDLATCDAGGVAGSDHCGDVRNAYSDPPIYDVGEAAHRLVDDLSGPPWNLPGERVYRRQPFCGGRRNPRGCDEQNCASGLFEKLALAGDDCGGGLGGRRPTAR